MANYRVLILGKTNFEGDLAKAHDVTVEALANGDKAVLSTVVTLEAANIDEVFVKLNHGSGEELPGYRGRSLSVGDVVIDEAGVASMCAPSGWRRLLPWCEACKNMGFLHAIPDSGEQVIERCDACKALDSDEDAVKEHRATCQCDWLKVAFSDVKVGERFYLVGSGERFEKMDADHGRAWNKQQVGFSAETLVVVTD